MARLGVLLVLVATITAACGSKNASRPPTPGTTSSPTTTAPPALRKVKVYFVSGEQFHAVTRTVAPGGNVARTAVQALLEGPTNAESATGVETTIPSGAHLDSLSVASGTATVALSHAQTKATAFDVSLRPARAAQVVYTLTAIRGIQRVVIRLNGEDRAQFEGEQLAVKGPLAKHDLSRPVTLPMQPAQTPAGAAPANPAGVQRLLVELHYLPAEAVTGGWDYRTSQAVMAFQSWEGLDRDGAVGPQTLAALETAKPPKPAETGTGRRIEVFRSKGVTLLLDGSQVVRAVHTSSGAPGYETNAGSFTVFRKERNSWSYPYQVWLPWASYFDGGIAFHEYKDVPPYPASHGCVRVPAPEAPFVYDFAATGIPVTVY
ncbi:MAG TPA: GerMN domain-containing protein [Gaiellaceae bacterium]|nr:GerMN domain-containing protein [Gaiellaceae bacterium]